MVWGTRKFFVFRRLRLRLAAGSLTERLLGGFSGNEWDPEEGESLKQKARRKRNLSYALLLGGFLLLAFGLGFAFYNGLLGSWYDHGPIIDLGYTQYRGNYLDNNISEFLGMRYARPPTDELRWRAPVEPEATEGIHRAKQFGDLCLSISMGKTKFYDEDCLFVNVWAPTNATADMKLPVMVFIQGGGYTQLANPNWNGTQLVEVSNRGVVLVTFNYRVGLWGFLAGEEVRKDGHLNTGLLDQRFLLQWVQHHISKFGGDPNHVVIQGISAGAGSVAMHLTSYGGRDDGLFVGAIGESIFFPAQPSVSDLEYQLDRVMDEAGCSNEADRMKCLRGKSKKQLQRLNHPGPFPNQTTWPLFYWTPCVDGDFLQDLPYKMFDSGNFVKVPLLAGACTNEGSVFAPGNAQSPEDLGDFLKANYPGLTPTDVDDILALYPLEDAVPNHDSWFPSTSKAYGEATFVCPTSNILESFVSAIKSPSSDTGLITPSSLWSYRYDVVDEDMIAAGLGVPHVFEGPAVFGPQMLPEGTVASGYWSYNAPMVPRMMKYWLSFVKTLDPNTFKDPDTPTWEPWGVDQNRLLIQTDDSVMEAVDDDERLRCDFWKSIADVTRQ